MENKNYNAYIGKRIKEYRSQKKLTQEDMAKELDIATNHYGRIERGENSCTMNNFLIICNLLEINPTDLLGELILNKDNELVEDIDKLTLEDKMVVAKFVKFLISKK